MRPRTVGRPKAADVTLDLPVLSRAGELRGDARLSYLLAREWLVCNGLGGYASATLAGTGTRRYHSLFVPNLPAPHGRIVMLPRLDEEATVAGRRHRLNCVEFAGERIEGDGHEALEEFRLDLGLPVWRYRIGEARIEKRLVMPHLTNTVYLEYRLLDGSAPVELRLRPFVSFRGHDHLFEPLDTSTYLLAVTQGRHEIRFGQDRPCLRLAVRAGAKAHAVLVLEECVSHDVYYRVEADRGHDAVEDLYSPGFYSLVLLPGRPASLIASTEGWESLAAPGDLIFRAEHRRRKTLLAAAPIPTRCGWPAQLVLAADQFIVLPGSRLHEDVLARASGEEVRTVIAGYHWFTDWGRDTMISLEGHTLCTGRSRAARAILRTFAQYVQDGLLPNHFPEGRAQAVYNTADATFWYFHALDAHHRRTGDTETLRFLYPTLAEIVARHVDGTKHGIGLDPNDGLIRASQDERPLTWMDAKVGDWVVTPRRGKPVEVQALWYNALRLMAEWAVFVGESPEQYESLASRAFESFNRRFWDELRQHLYDVIDGEGGDDPSLRPNQLFAISLRHPVLAPARWKPVLEAVRRELLTPVGLRTLGPREPGYNAAYCGDLRARDAAYHQGTVWPWLIGAFVDAWRRAHGPTDDGWHLLDGLREYLLDSGIGNISEIFDAEPPFLPRGCIAQAWSVAELLRTYVQLAQTPPSREAP